MRKFIVIVFIVLILATVTFLYWFTKSSKVGKQNTNNTENTSQIDNNVARRDRIIIIVERWNSNNYRQVINETDFYLQDYPEDSYIRMLRGISLLNVAQLGADNEYERDVQVIWEAIHEIRQSLITSLSFQYKKEAYYALGKAYYLLSGTQLTKAIDYLEIAIEKNIDTDDVYDFLISAYKDARRYSQAVSLVQDRISRSTDETHMFDLYLALIDLYLETEKTRNALDAILMVSRLYMVPQQEIELDIRKAQVQLLQSDVDTAISLLTNVVADDPRSYRAFYYLGIAYNEKGDFGQARYQWRQAFIIRPTWDKVIQKLSQTLE